MAKYWALPTERLRPFVDRYWSWEAETELPALLPGTGNELFLHFGAPVALASVPSADTLPRGHLTVARRRAVGLQAAGPVSFISARFRSGAIRHFCAASMRELNDRFPSCLDLWGAAGAELQDRISEAADFSGRAGILEGFLLARLMGDESRDRWLDSAIDQLYYRYSRVSVEAVADSLPVTRRHLERSFLSSVGVPPKTFLRNARFQAVLKGLLLSSSASYLEAALDAGYYDQSHFIHEFRAYTGQTPRAFLTARNFRSHFYNNRRPVQA